MYKEDSTKEERREKFYAAQAEYQEKLDAYINESMKSSVPPEMDLKNVPRPEEFLKTSGVKSCQDATRAIISLLAKVITPFQFDPVTGNGNPALRTLDDPIMYAINVSKFSLMAFGILHNTYTPQRWADNASVLDLAATNQFCPIGAFRAAYGDYMQAVLNTTWNMVMDGAIYRTFRDSDMAMNMAFHLRNAGIDFCAQIAFCCGGRTAMREFSIAARPMGYHTSYSDWRDKVTSGE